MSKQFVHDMDERETRASYIAARNDRERIKRPSNKTSWNKVCQDLEADVRDTTK